MPLSAVAKGKKRAIIESSDDDDASSNSPPPVEAPPLKRSKSRAETRPCPICKEPIPLRLLGRHAALEAERIDHIISQIGLEEPIRDEFEEDVGSSSRSRLSAMKARKFIAPRATKADSVEKSLKTLQTIKRHRKQRHAKLKEMLKEDDDAPPRRNGWTRGLVGGQLVCPICQQTVRGDEGVLEAHVDTCVANEELRREELEQQEALQRQYEAEAQWEEDNRGTFAGDLRGAGFHTRDRQNEDVEDEIDIDGDDFDTFGVPQFTEGDIVPLEGGDQDTDADADVDIDDEERPTIRLPPRRHSSRRAGPSRPASPHENPARLQVASMVAKKQADRAGLKNVVDVTTTQPTSQVGETASTSPTCRICLDPYEEPTVSTGCWHTCCAGCWLRCLGSTKLCPICKRITVPGDLRRIYL